MKPMTRFCGCRGWTDRSTTPFQFHIQSRCREHLNELGVWTTSKEFDHYYTITDHLLAEVAEDDADEASFSA